MPRLDSYVHRTGTHCGAAALRNVANFYNWGYDEPECFGFGAGLVFDVLEDPETESPVVRPSAEWLIRAFFDNLDIPHSIGSDDDPDGAWADVADTIDSDDPALLFLDPSELPYLPDEDVHTFPHVVVAIGYDDDGVVLSDATVEDVQTMSLDELQEAWTVGGPAPTTRRYVTVTRARSLQDDGTAAARAINQTVDYFDNATDAPRTTGRPGDEGIPALRSFAADLPDLSDHDDPAAAAGRVVRAVDWHGDDTAFRGLYAESLSELAPRAGLGGARGDDLANIAEEWREVVDRLRAVSEGEADPDETLEEAGSLLADVARREAQFFERMDRDI